MRILFIYLLDIVLDVDKYLLKGFDDLWQADLVDMQSLSLHDDGVKYLLTCIGTFSKYAWVRPLKNKSGLCVKEAFESILREKVPLYLQTDKDTDLKKYSVSKSTAEYEIKFDTLENDDIKAAIVEGFNRTLKLACIGTLRIQTVVDMLTCYKTWCTRTTILITAVSKRHPSLLMLKRASSSTKIIS